MNSGMKRVVINDTKQTILVSDLEVAETGWQRMRGLIGRAAGDFIDGKGLWILPCEGVHTIGMKFPIDVAYLDSNNRVLFIYQNLHPFRVGKIKTRAKSALELPSGMISKSRTEVGDLLRFSASDEKIELGY